jgi:hypothetical protein
MRGRRIGVSSQRQEIYAYGRAESSNMSGTGHWFCFALVAKTTHASKAIAPEGAAPALGCRTRLVAAPQWRIRLGRPLFWPANMKRVCQGLIVLIAILSVIGAVLGSAPPPASHVGPISPNSPSNPSIIR